MRLRMCPKCQRTDVELAGPLIGQPTKELAFHYPTNPPAPGAGLCEGSLGRPVFVKADGLAERAADYVLYVNPWVLIIIILTMGIVALGISSIIS